MKTRIFLSLWCPLLLATNPPASDDIVTLVQAELKKAQQTVKSEWFETKHKLENLKAQKDRALQDAKARVDLEKAGIDYFKDAITLITAKYVNEKGVHQAGMEISVKDQDYINRLFQKFLFSQPLQGRTSAGETVRALNWGIFRIGELIKVHSMPVENTNPELEILSLQIKDTEKRLARKGDLARRLGVRSEELKEEKSKDSKDSDDDEKRGPASEKDKKDSKK